MAVRPSFFAELKRRNVLRAAALYIGAVWALAQGISQLSPAFNLPLDATRWFVIACAIAFPFWIAFAWYYAITPQGIKRESDLAPGTSVSHSVARKLDFAIIGVLALAVVLLATQLLWRRAAPAQPSTAQVIPAKSIAVLPFENLSGEKDNAYFVAGMQDLILTKLADIGDLKVIARTSTEKYASHPEDLKTVGQQLGVATILEGSVQKAGNQVLINVQLIDCKTDAHVWAEAYTKTLDNVFGVEGEVAGQIASSLNARLSPTQAADLAGVPTTDRMAYDAFLRAEYRANQNDMDYAAGGTAGWKAAIPLYREAVQADPAFALAMARLSYVESHLAWYDGSGDDVAELNAQARTDAERALRLAPDLASAQLALGYTEYWGRAHYAAALQFFASALKLKPNDAEALAAQGYVQRRQGEYDAAIVSFSNALALDPRSSRRAYDVGLTYMAVGRYTEAGRALQHALALNPDNLSARFQYPYTILYANGDAAKALAAARGDAPIMKGARVDFLTFQRRYADALAELDGIPDTPDMFDPVSGGSKARQQADLYRLSGDGAKARALYGGDLPRARAALDPGQREIYRAEQWGRVAADELGLGHVGQGLAALSESRALADRDRAEKYDLGPYVAVNDAGLYARAGHPELAVPLLTQALATPGGGDMYAPTLLWLDPAWDPIRHDPAFEALLAKYAGYKPAVIYSVPPASTASAAVASAPASSSVTH